MESEKAIYWMTLGVLTLATITGFVTGHRGWGDRLAERSIALASQATEMAANYSGIAGAVLGSGENDLGLTPGAVVEIQSEAQNRLQARLACAQRTLMRRQAEMVRLQAVQLRVRVLQRAPRAVVWPGHRTVIEIPQIPDPPEDTF